MRWTPALVLLVSLMACGTPPAPPPPADGGLMNASSQLIVNVSDLTSNLGPRMDVVFSLAPWADTAAGDAFKRSLFAQALPGSGAHVVFTLVPVPATARVMNGWYRFAVSLQGTTDGWFFLGFPSLPANVSQSDLVHLPDGYGLRLDVGSAPTVVNVRSCMDSVSGENQVSIGFSEALGAGSASAVTLSQDGTSCTQSGKATQFGSTVNAMCPSGSFRLLDLAISKGVSGSGMHPGPFAMLNGSLTASVLLRASAAQVLPSTGATDGTGTCDQWSPVQ